MIWQREFGIDDPSYTDDCYYLLPEPEKALLAQRERDAWDLQASGSDQDWGLDDPETLDYELPSIELLTRPEALNLDSYIQLNDYGKDAA